MDFFHLRSMVEGAGPPVPYPQVSAIWDAYQQLDRSQWLIAAKLESLQLQRINTLLKHCFEEVPYYRRILSGIGFPDHPIENLADFRRIPLLTRQLYQEHFADIQATALPQGMEPLSKGSFTSGTNGVPIKVLRTNRDVLAWNAFYLRDLEWNGLDPRGRLAAIRLLALSKEELPQAMAGMSSNCWRDFCPVLMENGPSFAIDIRQEPQKQLDWLREVRPDFLLSMPTNLEFLASLLLERGEKLPGLKIIQAMGEPLAPEAQQKIEAGFGVPVKNLYSTTECGYIASPCPAGYGLHVHSENVLVEILDEHDQPCPPGQSGRLVFTSLHNFITPFIRYDIVDDAMILPEPCPCGRGLPRLGPVVGRSHPLLHLPDERRKSSMGITLGIRKAGGVHQFQIIQRAIDHVVLRVVPDKSWNEETAEKMRQAVRDEFQSDIRVDVEQKRSLQRPPGGKLKIVIIEMDENPPAHR